MRRMAARVEWTSDRTVRVSFIGDGARARVRAVYEALRSEPVRGQVELTPTTESLQVTVDPLRADARLTEDLLRIATNATVVDDDGAGRVVEIPVRYGGEFGPDLGFVAQHAGMSEEAVIERHCAGDYRVAFMGFAPGFGYLEGLDERIAAPRMETPRVRVAAGSVGIAGSRTAVYPGASPGGWRLIGRTDVVMFDAAREPASVLSFGDRVRFVRVHG